MNGRKQVNRFDLTEGTILSKLLLVALPIMGVQIVQMTYNLTDMFWLGRVGANAVAASGTVGMYLWLSNAFMIFGRMGAEIGVAQSIGRKNMDSAKNYGETSFTINIILGILYAVILMVGNRVLVGFFNIPETEVVAQAQSYLFIVAIGIPFTFITSAVTGIFNGAGNALIPFVINGIGLVINMILDPVLIFNFNMGIEGAAIATIIAQIVASILSVLALLFIKHRPFKTFRLFIIPSKKSIKQIIIWAAPIAFESFFFTILSMFISRFVAKWGANAMATSRIGSQIESLSWLIAGGFASALTAYMGQNFGAKKWDRIQKGFSISQKIMGLWGIFVTALLYFGGGFIFKVFMPGEPDVIKMGAVYLAILAICQLPCCLEGIAGGAFRGMGKTMPPSIVSITCNALRVMAAYVLQKTGFGLEGIWWAVSIGALCRGIWIYLWYMKEQKKLPLMDTAQS